MVNEKRLIDANALKEKLQDHHDFFVNGVGGFRYLTPKDKARVDEITHCIAEIVNAPTVDAVEVVHARWRWGYNSMNQYGAWCAECECGWEDKGTNDDFIRVQGLVIAHKYCPNCGAKMDGGNEDV